ncbi:FBD-associated F-box protein At4g10400-like [Hibiscus syriacus]|uniref:FBD-associated F-box protein At4g10400-like n=1 Tax=Hibiscus syriacus TaxID=106335 RepID=UPI0019211E70|nr:FBD-associated F-box protein At4g10400-like [Hibiscus syriacus]
MANAEAAAKVDRMSDLPDEILCHIFSFLESHQSIRLSSLSSRYRYLWRSVPTFDFWDNHHSKRIFEKLIENGLKFHKNLATIRKFRLWCISLPCKESLISKCIDSATAASCSNLQVLDIYLGEGYLVDLSPIIFSCKKLTSIRLSGGIYINEIPTDTRVFFPCLKTLRLKSISIVGGNTLNKLLSGCPRFETFNIERCYVLSGIYTPTVMINKLQIKYQLKPSGIHEDGDSNRVSSLASASIIDLKTHEHNSQVTFDLLNSISGIVQQMMLFTSRNEIYNSNYVDGPVFWPNLKHLEVKASDNLYDPRALSLLLAHSPNLISLVLEKEYQYCYDNLQTNLLPNVLYKKLDTVKIGGFDGRREMGVVKYFLKNALVLKKLMIGHCYNTGEINEETEARILKEPRASAQSAVVSLSLECVFRIAETVPDEKIGNSIIQLMKEIYIVHGGILSANKSVRSRRPLVCSGLGPRQSLTCIGLACGQTGAGVLSLVRRVCPAPMGVLVGVRLGPMVEAVCLVLVVALWLANEFDLGMYIIDGQPHALSVGV